MRYRLKDRGLQKKLDEISNGDFTAQFKNNIRQIISTVEVGTTTVINFGRKPELSVRIRTGDIESIRKYSPKTWNSYPDVNPPEGVWMRTEMRCYDDKAVVEWKLGAVFKDGKWRDSDGDPYPPTDSVIRFRPWED